MNKQDRKMFKKFMLVCTLTNKANLQLIYFTLKDLYFTKILHRSYVANYNNYILYGKFDKLDDENLCIIYAGVCRCCYVRHLNVFEGVSNA